MNVSDSERISTSLSQKGYEMTFKETQADVIILNTCSVREKAEHKLYSRVGRIRKSGRPKPIIGVAGCVAQLDGDLLFNKIDGVDFVLGTRAVGRVAKAIDRVLEGNEFVIDIGEREPNYELNVDDSSRHSPYVAFLPIIEGCNKFCTYCIVPFSRGREISIDPDAVVDEVHKLQEKGIREVHLIGQNVNSYRPVNKAPLSKFAGRSPFSKLLRAVAETGIERIKFTTSFPRDFNDEIVEAIEQNENLCNWVHLPVQSGSNRVLARMKRGHSIEKYFQKIDRIKASNLDIALTTDIIVGFPGETDEDFRQSVAMVEYCGFDSAYIFRYSPRLGTPASEMSDDVPFELKTERFIELERTQKTLQDKALQRYLNQVLKVLVERSSTRTENGYYGHSTCQKIVNFRDSENLLGRIVDVRITEIKSNSLFGELIQ